jgi:hypothetical protein
MAPAAVESTLMAAQPGIRVGTRVRIPTPHHTLTLRKDSGTVVGTAPLDPGYLLVRLDEPALYDNGFRQKDLQEIVEAPDNLEVLATASADQVVVSADGRA